MKNANNDINSILPAIGSMVKIPSNSATSIVNRIPATIKSDAPAGDVQDDRPKWMQNAQKQDQPSAFIQVSTKGTGYRIKPNIVLNDRDIRTFNGILALYDQTAGAKDRGWFELNLDDWMKLNGLKSTKRTRYNEKKRIAETLDKLQGLALKPIESVAGTGSIQKGSFINIFDSALVTSSGIKIVFGLLFNELIKVASVELIPAPYFTELTNQKKDYITSRLVKYIYGQFATNYRHRNNGKILTVSGIIKACGLNPDLRHLQDFYRAFLRALDRIKKDIDDDFDYKFLHGQSIITTDQIKKLSYADFKKLKIQFCYSSEAGEFYEKLKLNNKK